MRNIILILLLVTCACVVAQSQADSLVFTGQVFDQETGNPVEDALFTIGTHSYATDKLSKFRFKALKGDSVIFSHLGYKDLLLLVSDSLNSKEFLAGVFLTKQTYELSEVLVVPRAFQAKTLVATNPVSDADMASASKNVKRSAKLGLLPQETWDATENQKYVISKHTTKLRYKTQVPPNMVTGVSSVTVVPEVRKAFDKDVFEITNLGSITTQETFYLTTAYNAYRKKKLNEKILKNDSISVTID